VITLHTDAKENGYDNYETRNGVYFPSTESSYDGFGDEDTPECPEYT
jgi:hypothetical protein